MAKERSAQVGVSLERVICGVDPSTAILLKLCLHIVRLARGVFQLH